MAGIDLLKELIAFGLARVMAASCGETRLSSQAWSFPSFNRRSSVGVLGVYVARQPRDSNS